MIVVVDTFDWREHPEYVPKGEAPQEYLKNYQAEHGTAYKAIECYRLDLDWEQQIALDRARHWELPATENQ